MKFRLVFAFAFLLAGLTDISGARAQAEPGEIIDTTTPISAELRDQLNTWLEVSPPAPARFYVVTFVQPNGDNTYVSLAAIAGEEPPLTWGLEDGSVVWIGSVIAHEDGSVSLYTNHRSAAVPHLSMPSLAPGGGSYVGFPWQAGKQMQYGPRAIHGSGDYGTSGMYAVDLVSGEDLGTGAAPPTVYASDTGTVDYVCDDADSTAIRTYNATKDDYFIYAHLEDNSGLAIDHVFSRGAPIGRLVYGSFGDPGEGCGYAVQADRHYHLHWMFEPANGSFRAENCILSFSTKKWTCGTQIVGTGQWLTGGGGSGGFDDPNGEFGPTTPTFFDYIILGVQNIVSSGIVSLLPEHNSPSVMLISIYNTAKLFLRVSFILLMGNFNVTPFLVMLGVVILFRIAIGVVWIFAYIMRTIKMIPGL
jgi:hypothetical protein